MTDGKTYSYRRGPPEPILEIPMPLSHDPTALDRILRDYGEPPAMPPELQDMMEQQLAQYAARLMQTTPPGGWAQLYNNAAPERSQAEDPRQELRRRRPRMDRLREWLGLDGGDRARDPADARAHELLLRLLTPDQRREYERCRTFRVERDGKRYVLNCYSLVVTVSDANRPSSAENTVETWCVFCPNTPREDTLIAQLLLLRDDPEKLRAKAHVTRAIPYPG